MADPRDRAEAEHHFLADVENRNEQEQRPEQVGAVVLACLGVGTERAASLSPTMTISPGPTIAEQGLQLGRKTWAGRHIASGDSAESPTDVADVFRVEDGDVEGGCERHHRYPKITWRGERSDRQLAPRRRR